MHVKERALSQTLKNGGKIRREVVTGCSRKNKAGYVQSQEMSITTTGGARVRGWADTLGLKTDKLRVQIPAASFVNWVTLN